MVLTVNGGATRSIIGNKVAWSPRRDPSGNKIYKVKLPMY